MESTMNVNENIRTICEQITSTYVDYDVPPSYADRCHHCHAIYGNANLTEHYHEDDCIVELAQQILNELDYGES